jgi:dihydrofolate reductase
MEQWVAQKIVGKPVIAGRRTWDELLVWPPVGPAHTVVLTRDQAAFWRETTLLPEDYSRVSAATSPNYARWLANYAPPDASKPEEAVVLGGAETFRAFLPLADTVYLAKVDPIGRDRIDGADAFFDYPLSAVEWDERPDHDRWFDAGDGYRVGFYTYRRTAGGVSRG